MDDLNTMNTVRAKIMNSLCLHCAAAPSSRESVISFHVQKRIVCSEKFFISGVYLNEKHMVLSRQRARVIINQSHVFTLLFVLIYNVCECRALWYYVLNVCCVFGLLL